MKKQLSDLLIITRPDHSLQIYDSLLGQDIISFRFLTFKVVPAWVKKVLRIKRLVGLTRNFSISIRTTIVNLCKYSFRFSFAKNWSEENIMAGKIGRIFKRNDYKIIHYWPIYCYEAVEAYARTHPDAFVIADVHMPNPVAIMEAMRPVYARYGIAVDSTDLSTHAERTGKLLAGAPAIMVPSDYVANTYKLNFPDKKYYVVTYGIFVTDCYEKRYKEAIRDFVYAGGSITLEKGCDLLCEYFEQHAEYNVHLFGSYPKAQAFIFEKYRKCPNIFFHGHVAKNDLPEYVRKYDVGIHLSRFDAYSLAVGEILGTGLPTIVSTSTGNCDDITNEGMGLVTELDFGSIDTAIKKLAEKEFYNRCVDNIDRYIRFRHKSFGEKMIDFYKSHLN